MSDIEIKLVTDRPNRGKYPVSLMRGAEVLLAGEVNPHKIEDIKAFVKQALSKLPGLKGRGEELKSQLLQLAAPKEPSGALQRRSPEEHPYSESSGATYWLKPMGEGEVPVPLMNFSATIVADVVRDDGAERETAFKIEAVISGQTHEFIIPAARFSGMNWPTEHLGAQAIVYPGQSIRDHARAAIQFLSPRPIPLQTIFTHTGWRKLDGGNGGNGGKPRWGYLHGGGAIGAAGRIDGVQVELMGALAHYTLPDPPRDAELKVAIRATLWILELGADSLVFPVFCSVWRAALSPCDFGLHLAGPTGVFKSEFAALAQQFFGAGMDSRHLPGSWSSTDNALEGLLFNAKDAVTVVDDFAPNGGPHDIARWHQKADRVIRAQGNNAGRDRMRADGTLRPPRPPRGLVVSTGEEVPKGQSLRSRLLIREISMGDIDAAVLTRCQKDARAGLYAAAMAGFVCFLAGAYEQIHKGLRAEAESLRSEAAASQSHCRTPEIIANLALGMRYFISFARSAGAMTDADAEALWKRAWSALVLAGAEQAGHQAANEPAQRFIELLTSAIASGRAHLADAEGKAPGNSAAWGWRETTIGSGTYARGDWQPQGTRIGWIDGEAVYLEPDASHRVAQDMAGGGDGLVVSARTLRKRLAEKGWLIREGQREELVVRRMLEGRQRKVIQLAPGVLSPESTISTISAITPTGGPENRESEPVPMAENPPMVDSLAAMIPPSTPASGAGIAADGGNGGNGGKQQGEGVPAPVVSDTARAMPAQSEAAASRDDPAEQEERAAIMEIDGGLSREQAESLAAGDGSDSAQADSATGDHGPSSPEGAA